MSRRVDTNSKLNDDHFNDDIFIALLRKGANEYLKNDLSLKQPCEEKKGKSNLSEVTDKKIKNMIKHAIRKEKGSKAKKVAPKILVVTSAICLVFFVTVFSVSALRAPFLNFLVHTEEEITDIDLNNQQDMMIGESFEEIFGYIPKGFELESEEIQRKNVRLSFKNENEEIISIKIYQDGSDIRFDTEESEYYEIMIEEEQGFYSIKNGFTNLVFAKDEHAFFIVTSIEFSEVIKIAENIE